MSKGRSLESIKQRISDMKVKIEETEEREANAKTELVEAKERQMKKETEARSLRNRLETLTADLNRVQGKHSDILGQLGQNALRSEESESNRKRLEEKEEEGFEKTKEIEESAKSKKYELEEKENMQKEASLRESALVNDLRRVDANYERAVNKEQELQKQYDDIISTTDIKQNNVNALHEKEDDYKEKIAFLDDQIKQVTALEDERSAKIRTSTRMKERLEDEIQREREKIREIEKQFEEIEGV